MAKQTTEQKQAKLRAELEGALSNPNAQQFLNVLALSEGTAKAGQNGYDVGFAYTEIPNLDWHPGSSLRREFTQTDGTKNTSTAAGRYQFMPKTWEGVAKQAGLKDFGPESQDLGALALVKEKGALNDVLTGNFDAAVQKLGPTWASLPSAPGKYKQAKHSWGRIRQMYDEAAKLTTGLPNAGSSEADMARELNRQPAVAENIFQEAPTGPIQLVEGDFIEDPLSIQPSMEPIILRTNPKFAETISQPQSQTATASAQGTPAAPIRMPFGPNFKLASPLNFLDDSVFTPGMNMDIGGRVMSVIPENNRERQQLSKFEKYDLRARGALLRLLGQVDDANRTLLEEQNLFDTYPNVLDSQIMELINGVA